MAATIEVEIIGTETIKPSSPTPVDLKSFRLSLLDQIAPALYTPIIMFYPCSDGNANPIHRSDMLKKSLSITLSRFYIFAGRLKGYSMVDCNDDGVDFIEARINCRLYDVLNPPNPKLLNIFLPIEVESSESGTGRVLLVQATYFSCGGMAIGLCLSHKVADASSLSAFMKSWSAAAIGTLDDDAELPLFAAASLMPPLESSVTMPALEIPKSECVLTRLVFDGTKIFELQNKIASENGQQQPTRVEAVTALIWKCAMSSTRSNSGLLKPSVLCQYVNLRKRIEPPLPSNLIGNIVSHFMVRTNDKVINLHVLVEQLRNGIKTFTENKVKKLQDSGFSVCAEEAMEQGSMWTKEDLDFYLFTSWCKFQLYGADFGWGKPSWISIAKFAISNSVLLMDTKDGEGIEAWLTLSKEDMIMFESNEQLLAFASLNPSIVI